jgi:hypothetical protein
MDAVIPAAPSACAAAPAPASREGRRERVLRVLERPRASRDLARFRRALARSLPSAAAPPGSFEPARPRFDVWPTDVPRVAATVAIEAGRDGTVVCRDRDQRIVLSGIGEAPLRTLLRLADGSRSIRALATESSISVDSAIRAVRQALGTVFLLEAVDRLSSDVAHLEVCRYPGSPYDVNRRYWQNCVAVRHALSDFAAALASRQTFCSFLRELHVCYIMGAGLNSFYLPASSARNMLMNKGTGPGELRPVPVDCPLADALVLQHIRLLAELFGDPFGDAPDVAIRDDDGLLWGHSESHSDAAAKALGRSNLFWPAEKVSTEHVDRLWRSALEAYHAAHSGNRKRAIGAIAQLLHRFVCLHPFAVGNIGLIMNIVNWLLRQAAGGYVCHFYVDWCGQCLSARVFAQVFERLVDSYLVDPSDPRAPEMLAARLREVRDTLVAMRSGEPLSLAHTNVLKSLLLE